MELRFNIQCDKSRVRLDQYLVSVFPDISRSKLQTVIKSDALKVNGISAKPNLMLSGGEHITCDFQSTIDEDVIPQKIDLEILYEDDDMVVVNKQAGLVVHPGSGNWDNTLVNGLLYHFKNLSNADSDRPGIVHRLDKDTSGVIIIAKTDYAHHYLSQQFQKREIRKEYKALVWGIVKDADRIESKLGRNPRSRQLFSSVITNGRTAVTRYEPIKVYPPLTWISLYPETGRTHQLRVHMKEISHPIIQDHLYGGDFGKMKSFHEKHTRLIKSVFKVISRAALHAYSIEIEHPRQKKRMTFTAEIPVDIKSALEILENDEQ